MAKIVVPPEFPIAAPSAGLAGNSNYFLYSPGEQPGTCSNLLGLEVTINVTEDIAGSEGFGFQLNAYSPSPFPVYAQQYVISLNPMSNPPQLEASLDNGPVSPSNILLGTSLTTLAAHKLPAGYQLSISLEDDPSGKITGAKYVALDQMGNTLGSKTISLHPYLADLAPVVTFQVNLVAFGYGLTTMLSSGAGTMTYSASNLLAVTSAFPGCAAAHYITDEKANSVYGDLLSGQSQAVTQSFGVLHISRFPETPP